ncbi:MAG: hypothetical protein DCC58_05770 [Chloroflexi bacterium]|nr:MAG: hypothetical protein DCC58_05770 [Chloroflexota bacterium]
MVEFGLLRLLIRSGPALAGEGRSTAADLVVLFGHTAMNFGVGVALVCLAVVSRALFGLGGPAWRASAGLVALLVALLSVALLRGATSPQMLALTAGVSIAAIITATVGAGVASRHTAALALFGVAYSLIFAHLLAQALTGQGVLTVSTLPAFYASEAVVVLAAVGSLLLVPKPWSPARALAGALPGVVLVAGHAAIPWLVATLGVWNFGVSMSLPTLAYGVAVACFTTTALHLWGRARPAAIALLLIALGGMKLDLVYFHLLGMSGFMLLTLWVAEGQIGAVRARASAGQQRNATVSQQPISV